MNVAARTRMAKKVAGFARFTMVSVFVLAAVVANAFTHTIASVTHKSGTRFCGVLHKFSGSRSSWFSAASAHCAKFAAIRTGSLITVYPDLNAAAVPFCDLCISRAAVPAFAMFATSIRKVCHRSKQPTASCA